MSEWETFCDESYYSLWRVHRKNERGFNDGYHIHNGEEARSLVELLNGLERERDELRSDLEFRRGLFKLQEQQLNEVRAERDKWKAKFIQQNKDLGCEMMDPNGTIWDHAKKLQEKFDAQELELFALNSKLSEATEEIEEIQEQLNTYIMLDKMAMRKFMRDLEKERQKQ